MVARCRVSIPSESQHLKADADPAQESGPRRDPVEGRLSSGLASWVRSKSAAMTKGRSDWLDAPPPWDPNSGAKPPHAAIFTSPSEGRASLLANVEPHEPRALFVQELAPSLVVLAKRSMRGLFGLGVGILAELLKHLS